MVLSMNNSSLVSQEDYLYILTCLLSSNLDFHDEQGGYATHNFHSFPAKFPPQLPKKFIETLTKPGDIVLDPMAGSGTTIVEAVLADRASIGIDIDPLALKIIKVKTTPIDKNVVTKQLGEIIFNANLSLSRNAKDLKDNQSEYFGADTKKFINQWFLPETQLELYALIKEIRKISDLDIQNFFLVCFSAIVITKSGGVSLALDLGHTRPHLAKKVIDRTGKLLFGENSTSIPSYLTKTLKPTLTEFEKRCLQNLNGLLSPAINYRIPNVIFGNAQLLPLPENSVDLIVTSPPYASNAIDYMRAHKYSLTWLGHSIKELSLQRNKYIGGESTSEYRFEVLPEFAAQVVNSLNKQDKKKSQVLHRYYSEMTHSLREMFRVLKPGKSAIVVVGNSTMRGMETQTDICLAEIGKSLGFQVPRIGVRQLERNKRMLPAGMNLNLESQIQQRMHEEYVIGFYKPIS